MRRTSLVTRFVLVILLVACAWPAHAQRLGVARAFDLERRGSYAQAVEAYRRVLEENPGDITGLLGLERSLLPLGRTDEIIPLVRQALQTDSTTSAIYAIGVRAWASLDEPDSLEAMVRRWASMRPDEETPYREWGRSLLRGQDRDGARRAYLAGREALGEPSALAAELALLATAGGNYAAAAREWALAAHRLPGYRASALSSLSQTPEQYRDEVLDQLRSDTLVMATRIEAELLARWGDPVRGYRLFAGTLDDNPVQAIQAIRLFLEPLRSQPGSEVRMVQGLAFEDMARRSTGPQAARMRLEAARAYGEAGDQESARRMLAALASDPSAPTDLVAGATATLIEVLVAEGRVDEAERRLEEFQESVGGEDRLVLRRAIAWGWIYQRELDRAAQLVATDSTVDGFAVSGYIALFHGDIKGTIERFQVAGPYAGTREEAAARTSLLALLQSIESDTVAALGEGLLTLHLGDSAAAVTLLADLAERLPNQDGGAELYLLIGKVAAATNDPVSAELWFGLSAAGGAPATAPAAELELARLLIGLGRNQEAVETLEHLILTYGDSAMVPQARRLLDQARGGVPRI